MIRKEKQMDDINIGEILVKEAKENQTRLILSIVKESTTLEEAEEKIKTLLENK